MKTSTLSDTCLTATQDMVIERVSDDRLLGRLLLLSIADDVAGWVAGDRLASPVGREAVRAHGAYPQIPRTSPESRAQWK